MLAGSTTLTWISTESPGRIGRAVGARQQRLRVDPEPQILLALPAALVLEVDPDLAVLSLHGVEAVRSG